MYGFSLKLSYRLLKFGFWGLNVEGCWVGTDLTHACSLCRIYYMKLGIHLKRFIEQILYAASYIGSSFYVNRCRVKVYLKKYGENILSE
jgi:hypothetical protein